MGGESTETLRFTKASLKREFQTTGFRDDSLVMCREVRQSEKLCIHAPQDPEKTLGCFFQGEENVGSKVLVCGDSSTCS